MLEPRHAKAGQRIEAEEIERAQAEDPAHGPRVQDDPDFKRGLDLADRRDRVLMELDDLDPGRDPEYLLQALEAYFQVKE